MKKVAPSPELLASAEEFVRSVTDRWAAEGHQITSEEVIKATALKVAMSTQKTLDACSWQPPKAARA